MAEDRSCANQSSTSNCSPGFGSATAAPGIPDGTYTIGQTFSFPFVGSIRYGVGLSVADNRWDLIGTIDNDILGVGLGHLYAARGIIDLSYQTGTYLQNNGEVSTSYRLGAGGVVLEYSAAQRRLLAPPFISDDKSA